MRQGRNDVGKTVPTPSRALRPPCSECGAVWSTNIWHQARPDERPVCRRCWSHLWKRENQG